VHLNLKQRSGIPKEGSNAYQKESLAMPNEALLQLDYDDWQAFQVKIVSYTLPCRPMDLDIPKKPQVKQNRTEYHLRLLASSCLPRVAQLYKYSFLDILRNGNWDTNCTVRGAVLDDDSITSWLSKVIFL
jgi:hypothetical protein